MPFNTNVTTGGVVYSPGTFDSGKVLTEDWETDAAGYGPKTSQTAASGVGDTLRTLTPLDIPIAKYERLILKYHIHYEQNTTGRAKFKIDTPTVTDIHGAWNGQDPAGSLIAGTFVAADPTKDLNVAGTAGYLEAELIIENGSANGTISLQFAQYANNAAPVIIKQGTFVEVQRF